MKIAKVLKTEGCWQLTTALSVSQILKNVNRSMQPELILHIEDTIFVLPILQTPLGGSKEARGQRKNIASDLKSRKRHP